MGRVSGAEIWESLEKISIPSNVEHKLRKFAQQNSVKNVLSLGGGGAKGCVGNFILLYFLEKLDLLQYIEEVWGTSAGAMMGACYCAGLSLRDLCEIVATIQFRDMVSVNVRNITDGAGYIGTEKVHAFFERVLPVKEFKDCIKPFFVLSTRYTGESDEIVIWKDGNLADGVTAAISIPGVFRPYIFEGKKYCDGGLIENTPSISVFTRHRDLKDNRRLAILSTCFGKEVYNDEPGWNPLQRVMNLMAVYRYRLQNVQNEWLRLQPNTGMLMINLDVPIAKMAFNKMGPVVVPVYGQLLDKMSYICQLNSWNITY